MHRFSSKYKLGDRVVVTTRKSRAARVESITIDQEKHVSYGIRYEVPVPTRGAGEEGHPGPDTVGFFSESMLEPAE